MKPDAEAASRAYERARDAFYPGARAKSAVLASLAAVCFLAGISGFVVASIEGWTGTAGTSIGVMGVGVLLLVLRAWIVSIVGATRRIEDLQRERPRLGKPG